jgi:hypothetical protein
VASSGLLILLNLQINLNIFKNAVPPPQRTQCVRYKEKLVIAVQRNNQYLLWKYYETGKYTVSAKCMFLIA